MATLYEQLGGEAAVNAAVDIFYRHVLSDERVNYWFDGIDMDKQAYKQKAFMTMAFGGPHSYTGKNMRDAHGAMVARGLNDIHFDAIAENLELTLNELGVAPALIDQVIATVETTRSDVLCR